MPDWHFDFRPAKTVFLNARRGEMMSSPGTPWCRKPS